MAVRAARRVIIAAGPVVSSDDDGGAAHATPTYSADTHTYARGGLRVWHALPRACARSVGVLVAAATHDTARPPPAGTGVSTTSTSPAPTCHYQQTHTHGGHTTVATSTPRGGDNTQQWQQPARTRAHMRRL